LTSQSIEIASLSISGFNLAVADRALAVSDLDFVLIGGELPSRTALSLSGLSASGAAEPAAAAGGPRRRAPALRAAARQHAPQQSGRALGRRTRLIPPEFGICHGAFATCNGSLVAPTSALFVRTELFQPTLSHRELPRGISRRLAPPVFDHARQLRAPTTRRASHRLPVPAVLC
jgi:hypothetical protein